MKEDKISIICGIVFLLLSLSGINLLLMAEVSGESNVVRVYHEPDPVTSDDEVNVYLVVKSTDNISEVRYYYCEKEPEDKCYLEKDMNYIGNNTYTGKIQRFKAGTKVGYNISIEYDNGSKEYPASPEEYFYYRVEEGEDNGSDDTPAPDTASMVGAVGVAFILYWQRKKD